MIKDTILHNFWSLNGITHGVSDVLAKDAKQGGAVSYCLCCFSGSLPHPELRSQFIE